MASYDPVTSCSSLYSSEGRKRASKTRDEGSIPSEYARRPPPQREAVWGHVEGYRHPLQGCMRGSVTLCLHHAGFYRYSVTLGKGPVARPTRAASSRGLALALEMQRGMTSCATAVTSWG